jgi:hypothetical protein
VITQQRRIEDKQGAGENEKFNFRTFDFRWLLYNYKTSRGEL